MVILALTGAAPESRVGVVAGKSIWRALIAGLLLAIMVAPCPAAMAAWSGPDPHQCCHKGEDAPAMPDASACATMCAREQAERAVIVAPPADGSTVEIVAVALVEPTEVLTHAPEAPSPPGLTDVRLLTCTFLI